VPLLRTTLGALVASFVVGACQEDLAPSEPLGGGGPPSGARDAGADVEGGAPEPPPVPGLFAEYFDGYHDKVVERVEPGVDHDWKDGAPVDGVGKDRFSVRWTGTLTPAVTGKTTFAIDADDGVRLWIDGKLVIDDWRAHFVERHTGEIDLVKDEPVDIRLDYFEVDLEASVKLSWSADGLPEEVIPSDRFRTRQRPSGIPGPKPPFANPVIASDCPDPGVLGVTGVGGALTFYAACTGGSFPIRTSRDLVRWETVPGAAILPQGKPSWADNGGRNWAPELHRVGDAFLAYYTTVNAANVLSIGVAHATSPTGPWTDRGSALVEDPQGVIDATFFEDDDGSRWLFYKIDGNAHGKPTPIYVRRLAPDGLSFAPDSAPVQVLVNDPSTWEGGVVEAPWVVKREGRYYMFYSGNVYDHRYRTGVARATSITGPWEKKGPPILANNASWVGPGHGSVVRVPHVLPNPSGEALDYFVYHAWQNAGNGTAVTAKGRMVLVDRITWKDGWPSIGDGTPTVGAQPWPGEE